METATDTNGIEIIEGCTIRVGDGEGTVNRPPSFDVMDADEWFVEYTTADGEQCGAHARDVTVVEQRR